MATVGRQIEQVVHDIKAAGAETEGDESENAMCDQIGIKKSIAGDGWQKHDDIFDPLVWPQSFSERFGAADGCGRKLI